MNDHHEAMDNPYPGLRPFQADETHLFFGRDEQRTELLGRLRKSRFLAVVGTSGSGKSSLVRAGLLPGLYGGFMAGGASRWRIVDTRPGGDPIGRLAKALDSKDALRPEDDDDHISFTEAALRRTSLGLINVVKEARLPEGERVLVLVDQFEELFRFIDTARTDRARDDASAFVKLLLAAAEQNDVPIYVIITMRSDFLGDCARFRGLPEAINDGQYLIPRLTRDQRREAITGPASVSGVTLSPTLVNRLLNDVGDTPDQLPILQHALMRTFDRWQVEHPDADTIDLDDYEDVGGMSHALSRHADAVFKGLGDNLSTEERRRRWHIAEKLFKCITDVGKGGRKIRRLAKLQDIAAVAKVSVEEVAAVIDAFRQKNNSFLMPPIAEQLSPDSYIDISHESLIRNWSRLDRWVDQEAESARDYCLLAQKAELHQKGEEDLLGRQALRVANEWKENQQPTAAWAERYGADFESAMDFLAKSDARVTARRVAQERRKRIRKAVTISAVIAILTPLMMLLIFAGEEAEWAAERETTRAEILNGGADAKLFSFLEERIRREKDPALWVQEASGVDDTQDYYGRFDLAAWLESFGASDHANIVSKYTSWQSYRGELLLDAIWDLRLEPHVLNKALLSIGADENQLRGKDLNALLDAIYDGEIWISPEDLLHALRPILVERYSGGKESASLGRSLDRVAYVDGPDRWLVEVYTTLVDDGINLKKYSAIKTSYSEIKAASRDDDEYRRQHNIAEKAIFLAMQDQLRKIVRKPAVDVVAHRQELLDMLEIFEDLEESQVAETEDLAGDAIGFEIIEEIVVGSDGGQLTADRQEQPEESGRRIFRSIVELDSEGLEDRFERAQASSRSPQNSETSLKSEETDTGEQRKIAFVWTVKILLETVQPLIGLESQRALREEELQGLISEIEGELEDARSEEIFHSFDTVGTAPFTLWRLRDNQLYRSLEENEAFKSVKQTVIDLYGVLLFGLLWFVWSGLRRDRARKGKTFAARVGLFRLGLASLVDVSVAFIVGSIVALAIGASGALVLAIGLDTFQFTDDVMGVSFALVFATIAVAYLLLRDVMHFRYRRSFGKILFEFRPIDTDGAPLGRGASVRRNWMTFIGIVLAMLVVLLSIGILSMFEDKMRFWNTREQLYLFLVIGFFESVLLLGLFEKLGGRWSRTTVVDTRSAESACIGATESTKPVPLPASS